MTPLILLVVTLATWRISSMVANERGPFGVFYRIRERVGIQHGDDGRPFIVPEKFLAELFSCVWCNSVWIGCGLTILLAVSPGATFWISLPFSMSALAIMMQKFIGD